MGLEPFPSGARLPRASHGDRDRRPRGRELRRDRGSTRARELGAKPHRAREGRAERERPPAQTSFPTSRTRSLRGLRRIAGRADPDSRPSPDPDRRRALRDRWERRRLHREDPVTSIALALLLAQWNTPTSTNVAPIESRANGAKLSNTRQYGIDCRTNLTLHGRRRVALHVGERVRRRNGEAGRRWTPATSCGARTRAARATNARSLQATTRRSTPEPRGR